jgi:NAD(P)-dependent dehydrogenase (short-subunit alcohol dehydrogenase family)
MPLAQATNEEISKLTGQPSDVAAQVAAMAAVGKAGNPEDIANLVSFLASPGSYYITGESINPNRSCLIRLYRSNGTLLSLYSTLHKARIQ